MKEKYTAVLVKKTMVDENTNESDTLPIEPLSNREVEVQAIDPQEAHKKAWFETNPDEEVSKIYYNTDVVYDKNKGFI